MQNGIEITLDKVRTLVLDSNEIDAAERVTGTTIIEMAQQINSGKFSLGVLTALLWAGLRVEDPSLKIETVRPWVKGKNFSYAFDKVREALTPWFDMEKSPSPLADSPGVNSEPSQGTTSG